MQPNHIILLMALGRITDIHLIARPRHYREVDVGAESLEVEQQRLAAGHLVAADLLREDDLGPRARGHLGDSKNTVRGYCLDIPRLEDSLNN